MDFTLITAEIVSLVGMETIAIAAQYSCVAEYKIGI